MPSGLLSTAGINKLAKLRDVNTAAQADQFALVWDSATSQHVYIANVGSAATDASGFGWVIDEDNLASDLDTKVPTQQSVKAYVDAAIAGLTFLEATDIDTLVEINTILGDATLVTVEATDASGYGWVIDEDGLTSDSATKVPTQQSVKAYVDAAGGSLPVTDTTALAKGSADATKLVRLDVGGLTTATTRVLTVQDSDGTLALAGDAIAASQVTSGALTHERGGLELDVSAFAGVPLIDGGSTSEIKYNLTATTDPGVGDDSDDGYTIASRWVNVTLDKEFVCLDATVGAAVWTETTAAAGAGSGDCCGGDGTSWAARTSAEANQWTDITHGKGLFVAVSNSGTNRVMTSEDGKNWKARAAAEANTWHAVTYANGLFVAVSSSGTNRVMTSPDSITWTARSAAEANSWYDVTYGESLFVAVSLDGTNRVMTSPDGITWTARSAAEANQWVAVTYGNGLFVAVSLDGTNRVMTSPDGITWTARSAAEANSWYDVTYANGLFVAVSSSGTNRVMTSPDGITWTARSAAEANQWRAIAYGNSGFVAVSFDGTNRVMTSPTGITWTAQAAAEANGWYDVTYGNGLFVAVSYLGTNRVMTSGKQRDQITL